MTVPLAALGREYLLAGHLIDRSGMPHVITDYGREAMSEVAIEEWMGASPVYTRRTQRALGFSGDDVATIFKGMQLDIGAPHEFMDFRYRVLDAHHGEFWLESCGALMDVEPLGEDYVVSMCHHIEDPTFDATAIATNPRARMRPLHRPPRTPADRHPHCHWTVEIDPLADPVPEPEAANRVTRSLAATVELQPDGPPDLAGNFDPDFRLEDLSPLALERALREACLQGHLLVHSFLLATGRRWGAEVAAELGRKQFVGISGVAASRLAALLGLEEGGLDAIARVLELHPAFQPRAYVDLHVEAEPDRLVVWVGDCPALAEERGFSWMALRPSLDGILAAVAPRARARTVGAPDGGAGPAWEVVLDPTADPAPEPAEVTLTRFSTGADFAFSS